MNKKIAVALTIMTAAVVSLTAVSYASECEGVPGECEPANGSRGLKLGDGEGARLQDGSGGQQRGGMNGGGLGQGRGRAGK